MRLVRGEHSGHAMQAIQLLKQLHNLQPRTRIEIAGRLIGEDQRRTVDERLCDSHALLLASRELVRSVLSMRPDKPTRLSTSIADCWR